MIGLQVYTKSGMFLGTVNNVVMDLEDGKVDG
ncbi:MAG: PRC-barrel domain-containing protein, partial [Thermoplasmata archaeon]